MYSHLDIQIRPIEENDLEFLRELHNQQSTISQLTDIRMVNSIQQKKWFESICTSKTSSRFLVLKESTPIGCIRFDIYDPINRNLQIGGDIHEKFRGLGYGKKMFSCCLKYAFEMLNCHRVYLNTLENNEVAINMYNSLGMKQEGRLTESIYRNGRYFDCICMYMTEDMYRKNKDIA